MCCYQSMLQKKKSVLNTKEGMCPLVEWVVGEWVCATSNEEHQHGLHAKACSGGRQTSLSPVAAQVSAKE
eukprot:m.175453 g.175453  ORF g.175453 m.175453 type:complete len:70 (-) comp16547_c3_seq1:1865-2074(-)